MLFLAMQCKPLCYLRGHYQEWTSASELSFRILICLNHTTSSLKLGTLSVCLRLLAGWVFKKLEELNTVLVLKLTWNVCKGSKIVWAKADLIEIPKRSDIVYGKSGKSGFVDLEQDNLVYQCVTEGLLLPGGKCQDSLHCGGPLAS